MGGVGCCPGQMLPGARLSVPRCAMVHAGVGEPRGILNRKAGEEKFRLSLHPPAPDLALFVEQYWIVDWDLRGQAPYRQEVLTHPCVHLVFERGKSRIVGVVTGKFS